MASGTEVRRPALSVVVVSFNAEWRLGRCLEALAAETAQTSGVETVVVRAVPRREPTFGTVRSAFPDVRFIEAPAGATVPRMRSIGIEDSRGDVVALIEDDCVVEPGWGEAVRQAHAAGAVAVGGAVEPGHYRRALDWAVYFCDYGRFMLPFTAGPAWGLPGNNMSYDRATLADIDDDLRTEFQEAFVHRAWQARRLPMRMEPAMVVRNENRWRPGHATTIPFHHGRAYAGRRLAGASIWRRVSMSLLALPLPALKVARVAREVIRRRRHVGPMVASLPWVALLSTSWSAGESVGYLFGPGGSLSRWR